MLEQDEQGNQTAQNVYGTNLITRMVGTLVLTYMYNGHGDVTALLDSNGNLVATYYYDAFGNILEKWGSADNNILYGGYQYDEETGLYYLNARMYDPFTARFLQQDTYRGQYNDPLSLNLYTYCHNEPLMYIDPTGHLTLTLKNGAASGTNYTYSGTYSEPTVEISRTLKLGMTGDDVKALQEMLGVKADGIFGPQTAAAVKAYQEEHGLKVDGIVGNQTLSCLQALPGDSQYTSEAAGNGEMTLPSWLVNEFDRLDDMYKSGYYVIDVEYNGSVITPIYADHARDMEMFSQIPQTVGTLIFAFMTGKTFLDFVKMSVEKLATELEIAAAKRDTIALIVTLFGSTIEKYIPMRYHIEVGDYTTETYTVTAEYNGGIYTDVFTRTEHFYIDYGAYSLLNGTQRSSGYTLAHRGRGLLGE